MFQKIITVIGLVILLILLVLGAGLWWGVNKVNSPEFRQLFIAKLTASAGVDVEIERLRLGLFSAELDGVSIPALAGGGAAGEKFLSVRAIKASYSPLALLVKPRTVAKIELDTPVIIARQDAAGALPLPFTQTAAPPAGITTGGVASAPSATPLEFSLPEIVARDARLTVYASDRSLLLSAENASLHAALSQLAAGLQARGTLNIRQLTVKPGVTVNDATVPLTFSDNQLKLAPVQAGFYQGTLAGGAILNLAVAPAAFDATVTVSGADMSLLLADLDDAPPAVSGKLDAHFTGSGNFDAPQDLTGKGDLLILGPVIGKLQSYQSFTSVIGSVSGISVLQEGRFDNIQSMFTLAGKKIQLAPLEVNSPNLSITLSGPIGFDESLDLKGEITLAPGLLQVAQTVGNIIGSVNSLKNSTAQSPPTTTETPKLPSQFKLPLTVSGFADNPKIVLGDGTPASATQQEKNQSLFDDLNNLLNPKPAPAATNPAP
ncbi:MAG: AsmA-like C-terminal region-containing protein [Verrucomicrobiales bacterium]|jgi:uncharacterized protein involved in outer membrane biogenesis|nr:AsmA-like C-terminal region-containing protein [Verrucomicrobiales bacterium]